MIGWINLLQQCELLCGLLCAVFTVAEGEALITTEASAGQVIHQGAVVRHGQGRRDGEGLLFGQGHRWLHHPGDPPLKHLKRILYDQVWGPINVFLFSFLNEMSDYTALKSRLIWERRPNKDCRT